MSALSQLLEFLLLCVIGVVVVVVEAEVQVKARLLPQSARHQLLLHEQFLEEAVAEAEGEVAVDEVHEADAGPRKVPRLWLRRQQRLDDGMDDGAEVRVSLSGVALEQLLCLSHVVLAVVLEQRWGQTLQQLLVLLLPVGVVTGLTCNEQHASVTSPGTFTRHKVHSFQLFHKTSVITSWERLHRSPHRRNKLLLHSDT